MIRKSAWNIAFGALRPVLFVIDIFQKVLQFTDDGIHATHSYFPWFLRH